MSVQQLEHDTDLSPALLEPAEVEFERQQGVGHGEYQQVRGSIELLASGEQYDITVTELDDHYHLQVRGEEGRVIDDYIESENPYEDLPENDEELYRIIVS